MPKTSEEADITYSSAMIARARRGRKSAKLYINACGFDASQICET
jgi:hypothetical protein